KAHWPQARISVMVKPPFVPILAGNPFIDEVLPYRGLRGAHKHTRPRRHTPLGAARTTARPAPPRPVAHPPDRGVSGKRPLARALRAKDFDLALVAHRSLRSALAVWLARVPFRIGFSSSAGWFFYHRTVYFPWGMPDAERNMALLSPLKPGLRAQPAESVYLP